jgi:hypothetical protein
MLRDELTGNGTGTQICKVGAWSSRDPGARSNGARGSDVKDTLSYSRRLS